MDNSRNPLCVSIYTGSGTGFLQVLDFLFCIRVLFVYYVPSFDHSFLVKSNIYDLFVLLPCLKKDVFIYPILSTLFRMKVTRTFLSLLNLVNLTSFVGSFTFVSVPLIFDVRSRFSSVLVGFTS